LELQQLIHNGVIVPDPPSPRGLVITVHGEQVALIPKEEEMALAWAKKQGTPYVEDPVFVDNFLADFSAELGLDAPLTLAEVDFGLAIAVVQAEKAAKERMTKEERKALAAQRKMKREALRAQYGFAIVNGEPAELANYIVEPSGIFMGRGQHPLRGRWKEGARQSDITLNLSPDAPRPPGNWAEIVWQPESLWVARWKDKLSGKLKYVWLSDTVPIKQAREAQKFDTAIELHAQLEAVRVQIAQDLNAPEPKKRMIATACYLIDALCLRVGDEKDADEADTVGATTLRPEHVTLHPDGTAEFHFLGKDSIEWHKTLALPRSVRRNMAELIRHARPSSNGQGSDDKFNPTRDLPQLFPDISSRNVNAYLSGLMPGLTAKVFRTHHSTVAVQDSLEGSGVTADDPEYVKWAAATQANLEAAILGNHTKKYTGNWEASKARFEERLQKSGAQVARYETQIEELVQRLAALQAEACEKIEAAKTPTQREKREARYEKRIERAHQRIAKAHERLERAQHAVGKIKAQTKVAAQKRTWNLGTSLKSYVDPRVYHRWGQQVEYDVLERYYPKALRRKFAWVREESPEGDD
jgi:DNA topoisomerase-1